MSEQQETNNNREGVLSPLSSSTIVTGTGGDFEMGNEAITSFYNSGITAWHTTVRPSGNPLLDMIQSPPIITYNENSAMWRWELPSINLDRPIPTPVQVTEIQENMTQEQVNNTLEQLDDVSPYKMRFSEAAWFQALREQHIMVIGAGGIGSWVIFALSRIGCEMSIFDMDEVESHNLGGQLYNTSHVGMKKVDATKSIAQSFSGNENTIHTDGRYTEDSMSNNIVISAFDNMAGRKLAFEKWAELVEEDKENAGDYLFIDGRLLAEQYQVYAVTADKIEAYRATLFDDSEVEEVLCTLKSTTHCSMGIASDMVGILTNFMANKAYGRNLLEVPFSIKKNIPMFTYDLNFDGREEESNQE